MRWRPPAAVLAFGLGDRSGYQGFFDNLEEILVMKAVRHHDKTPWVLLYIERWLKAGATAGW
jgi:hypothetical protein